MKYSIPLFPNKIYFSLEC
ncbi:BnaC08g11830D [Brassica napus]|uniref:BnaC08g11830D protein n=1 Tax=Brassica napus TaxID=3708 RepID=A0A078FAT9_BRANA|nr:BnaC08g11830D [Brassica napus]